jgi:hypothetical protein
MIPTSVTAPIAHLLGVCFFDGRRLRSRQRLRPRAGLFA